MDIQRIMVIGAGQMGAGIAQVCAQANFTVILHDLNKEFVTKGYQSIEKQLQKQLEKGRISLQEKEKTLQRITPSFELSHANSSDFIIEAVSEKMDVKRALFQELDHLVNEKTILATNTSSLPITEIAAAVSRPERVIGMHFMNPVPVMALVEIIRGLATADDVYKQTRDLAKRLNKISVEVNDFPGFVSNRILMPMINEAIYTVYEGVASPEAIDEVMKLGMNHPMGPLALADFIGLDTCLSIMETLQAGFGDDKYRPCPLLRKYVKAGWLGRKTGRGFYRY